jgi:hypothetical protein
MLLSTFSLFIFHFCLVFVIVIVGVNEVVTFNHVTDEDNERKEKDP